MSNLPLHRLIAAAGGLVLPLITGDAPVAAASPEHVASLQVEARAIEPDRRDGYSPSTAAGSLASDGQADK